jgi:hypothetical protein
MAELAVTAASVAFVSGPPVILVTAGEAFSAGMVLYKRASDQKYLKAQCDGTAEQAGSNGLVIALASADAAGAKVGVAVPGAVVTLGAVAGTEYVLGTTAGKIMPPADLVSTNKATAVGVGNGSNNLLFDPIYDAGAVVP